MSGFRIALRTSLLVRTLNQRDASFALLSSRRAVSYNTSVNPQPPLDKAFEDKPFDPEAGPPGPIHPKVKQLQKFFQTPNGRPIWRKTAWDDFFLGITVILTGGCFLYSLSVIWWFINPKPVKK